MRNLKLTIEYDGTDHCGWQIQSNGVTVQGLIEKALAKMTGKKVRIIGASRTDAGVHAFGQTANFHTASKISCDGFLKGLNSLLPDDISIRRVEEAAMDFHSKNCALGKHYRYLIYCSVPKPAILKDRVWHLWNAPDIKKLKRNARPLVGVHDFSAFCASGDTNRSKVREIKKIACSVILSKAKDPINTIGSGRSFVPLIGPQDDIRLIAIDIIGTGFLKYMVRNIVGTMVGAASPAEMSKILASRDRRRAGKTAPACGLYLMRVFYDRHPESA